MTFVEADATKLLDGSTGLRLAVVADVFSPNLPLNPSLLTHSPPILIANTLPGRSSYRWDRK